MPLSKAKQAEYMREYRRKVRYNVIPKPIDSVQPESEIPLYNPSTHKDGDRVRMSTGKVVVIPNLDADGQVIPW